MSQLLVDFLELPAFAAEVKRHPRTVRRWLDQPDGLPYTSYGNTILIHVPTARDWLMRRMRNQKKRPPARRRARKAERLQAPP
jgi:hypothetical protein